VCVCVCVCVYVCVLKHRDTAASHAPLARSLLFVPYKVIYAADSHTYHY